MVAGMAVLDTLRAWLIPNEALIARAAEDYAADVTPPPRDAGPVGNREAATIPSVYRALQLLTTAASQLPLNVERRGVILPSSDVPAYVRRPSLDMSRSDWIEQVVMSLAVSGNAYWLHERAAGKIIALSVLNPHEVHVWRNRHGRIRYAYRGTDYTPADITHLHLQRLPGALTGLGPIQSAQATMRSAVDMREHMAGWFTDTGHPSGVLSTESALTGEDAKAYREAWNNPGNFKDNPTRVRVLGKGLTYEPILISPKDALWIEAQSFTVLEVARLFGTPSSLMLAAIEGNSQTYSNVEQEWLAFTRFTLTAYLRKIEEALTDLTPHGQTVRFNIDALLRSDTRSRYQAHAIGLEAGFLTVNEVRELEQRPPIAGGDVLRDPTASPAAVSTPAAGDSTPSQEAPA